MDINDFIKKIAEVIDVEDFSVLSKDTDFRDLDEWSSMATVNLIVFFDEEFGKSISNVDIRNCNTIEDLYNLSI